MSDEPQFRPAADVLLDVLTNMFYRTHRLLEQDHLDDFEMLEDLHATWYWEAEREDVLGYLMEIMPEAQAQEQIARWKQEFDEDYAEAAGLPEEEDDDDE